MRIISEKKPLVLIAFGGNALSLAFLSHGSLLSFKLILTLRSVTQFSQLCCVIIWRLGHLPPGCTRLAYSEPTLNQAFICKNRPIACVQFHPEDTRDMIRYYAREESEDWIPDRYVGGKEVVLHQTEEIRDTYWLMEAMLDNMDREFGGSLYGK